MTWYTVYNARTDEVMALGEAKECAAALGMSMGTFYCLLSRTNAGKNKKYVVLAEELDEKGRCKRRHTYDGKRRIQKQSPGLDREKALALYGEHKNDKEIAKILGAGATSVWRWRRKNDLPPNGRQGGTGGEKNARRPIHEQE